MRSRNLYKLLGVSILAFLVGLGLPSIYDSDEAFYAQASREMVESGDWLTPHYNGRDRFEKPILFYWLIGLAYLLIGITEAAARAPSALAGVILTLVTYACGRRWYDEATGFLAGIITATSLGYAAVARQALPDLALACFITVATWAGLMVFAVPRHLADTNRRYCLALCGLALAGGSLTKGPVGVVLPALVVGPLALRQCYVELTASIHGWWRPIRRLMSDLSVLSLIFVTLAAPWFLAMTFQHGTDYLERFFLTENFQRFATDRYNTPRPMWYYGPIIVGGLLPWSPFALLWIPPFRTVGGDLRRIPAFRSIVANLRRIQPVQTWLIAWSLAPVLFYSASIGKQPRYILPVLPPLAILLARALSAALRKSPQSRSGVLLAAAGLSSGALLILLGGLIFRSHILFLDAVAVQNVAFFIISSGLGVVILSLSSRQKLIPSALAIASVVTTLGMHSAVLSRIEPNSVEQMAALVRDAGAENLPYGRYRVFVRNLVFYTGRPHVDLVSEEQVRVFLGSNDPVLCVISEADLARIATPHMSVYELGRVKYLNTGSLTLRTLLWPDPARDIQTVLLVTNQSPED